MERFAEAVGGPESRAAGQVLAAYLALTKPRLVTMVVITAAAGFYLGAPGAISLPLFVHAMVGTAFAAGGALALNQYLERDLDACMKRTQRRPLPAGRVHPLPALLFGGALTVVGLMQLLLAVNPLACAVTALTSFVYLLIYTPLKRVTPLCTIVGAVPGALPPVTGWVAARGELGDGALVLFAILFLWQIPHSLAIARLYVDEYANAGFRLLPVVDRDSRRTERAVLSYSAALVAVGVAPALMGMAGSLYLASAALLGAGMFAAAVAFALQRAGSARWLLLASLVYLPVLLGMLAIDRLP